MNDYFFIGSICYFGFPFAPSGWMQCSGQLLSIANNTALFSLIGTTYGGDGVQTFALPNLMGRTMVHPGQGRGLTPIGQGEISGLQNTTLLPANLPMHSHAITGVTAATVVATTTGTGTNETDDNKLGFGLGGTFPNIYSDATPNPANYVGKVSTAFSGMPTPAGGSQPTPITNPYLGINTCISLVGIFPSRN